MLNLICLISHSERSKAVSTASDDAKTTPRKCSDQATKNLIGFKDTKSLRSVAARRAVRCAIAVVARCAHCGRICPL